MKKLFLTLAIGLASVYSGFAQCAKVEVHPLFLSDNTICPNTSIQIYNYFDTDLSYKINWGDGSALESINNNSNDSHIYTKVGKYVISLTGTNGCGNSDVSYDTINVVNNLRFPANSVSIYNNGPACPGAGISLSYYSNMPIKAKLWDFGNGNTSTLDYEFHSEKKVGNYPFTLKLTNMCGVDTLIKDTLRVVNNLRFPATSSINIYNNGPVCPGEEVYFSYSSYNMQVKAQLWDFGNGITSTKNYQPHSEAKVGNYPITLKLTNMCGIDTILKDTLKVVNNLRFSNQVNIYSNSNEVCPGASFYVRTEYAGKVKNYFWDFGDGTTSQERGEIDHTYATIGTKTISLKITNYCGLDTTLTTTVYVKPNVGFDGDARINTTPKACIGDEISFEARSSTEIKSYSWNFGDNSTATQRDVTHAYNANNTYNVSVKLTNYCGVDTLISKPVTIENAKTFSHGAYVSFDLYGPSEICPNEKGEFRFYPNNVSIKKAVWDFADGSPKITVSNVSPDKGSHIQHSFSAKGNYAVNLTLTNGCNVDTNIVFRAYDYNTNSYISNISVKDSVAINEVNFGIAAEADTICFGDYFDVYARKMDVYTSKLDFGDGTILSYADKSSSINSIAIFNHKYKSTGLKKIKLTQTNACGLSASDSILVYVSSSTKSYNKYNLDAIDYEIANFSDDDNYYSNDSIGFFVEASGASFTWTFGDGVVETNKSAINTHIYKNSGVFNTKVFIQSACGDTITLKRTINVEAKVAGIENYFNSSLISLYPNPSNDVINLSLTDVINGTVTLIDLQGNELVSKSINDKETSIATDNIPSGVYILKLLTDKASYTKQVILVK